MVDTLGLPTVFFTHSAADLQWPELARLANTHVMQYFVASCTLSPAGLRRRVHYWLFSHRTCFDEHEIMFKRSWNACMQDGARRAGLCSVSADTRTTESGQATAEWSAEVNVREHAALLNQQTKTTDWTSAEHKIHTCRAGRAVCAASVLSNKECFILLRD